MHKATGADGLSTKILKMAAPAISSSLAKLINYCIDNGCFPSAWKLAKAIPIYKGKGSKLNMSNYRPISAVLPLLSKIFERHILYNHLKDNSLLYNLQSGFHKTYSTETALVRLIDQINGLVFIDYKKAFDLIDHNILLSKLGSFYIAPKELALFENYLKDRTQFVNLNEYNSAHNKITHGVPQGSILGPLLFLVAISDLPNVVTKSMVDIYADDTTLSASASINSFSSVWDFLQDDINQVTTWSINNKMIINPSKTKALVITGKRLSKKLDTQNLNLMALGNSIDQVNSEKLLGVTMDSNLLFDDHIDELLTPDYIDDILVRNADLHLRTTRHYNVNLVCPRYKRESEGGRTFQVSGTKLWNTIPTTIKKKSSYNSFYKAIRSYYYNR